LTFLFRLVSSAMAQTDADELLLLSLRRAQVPSVPASLSGLSADALLALLAGLLPIVQASLGSGAMTLSDRLPAQIAARHKIASSVAAAVREFGFQGDWGANSLLYPNERDVRRLISWLAGKLPKAASEVTQESGGLASAMRTALASWVSSSPQRPVVSSSLAGNVSVLDAVERAVASRIVDLTGQAGSKDAGAALRATRAREVGVALAGALQAGAAEATAAMGFTGYFPGRNVAAVAALGGVTDPEPAGSTAPPLAAAIEAVSGRRAELRSKLQPHPEADLHEKLLALNSAAFAGTILGTRRSAFARTAAFAVAAPRSGINPLLDGSASNAVASASGSVKTEEEVQAERDLELARLQSAVDAADGAIKELSTTHATLLAALPALRLQLIRAQEVLAVCGVIAGGEGGALSFPLHASTTQAFCLWACRKWSVAT
jgi:hypothetical protein